MVEMCWIDKDKDCPLPVFIPLTDRGRLCQACIGRQEYTKMQENMKVMRAQLILAFRQMFPEEGKAREEYRKIMKNVEEW